MAEFEGEEMNLTVVMVVQCYEYAKNYILGNSEFWAGKMTQSRKCLLNKCEDMSLRPRTHFFLSNIGFLCVISLVVLDLVLQTRLASNAQ